MKKFLPFVFLLFVLPHVSSAQIGIGWSGYTGDGNNQIANRPITGITFSMPKYWPIQRKGKTIAYFGTGIAFQWEKAELSDNRMAMREDGLTSLIPDPDPTHEYRKSFLKTRTRMQFSYIGVPLQYAFRLGGAKGPWVAPGIYARYLVSGRFKRRYYENEEETVIRDKFKDGPEFYGINRWDYGVSATVFYKLIFFATYSISPVFKPDQGPELNRYSAGVMVPLFGGASAGG